MKTRIEKQEKMFLKKYSENKSSKKCNNKIFITEITIKLSKKHWRKIVLKKLKKKTQKNCCFLKNTNKKSI